MKEQVSVPLWSEGEDFKYLQDHIDKNWDNLADSALNSLLEKYERLKRLDENVKSELKKLRAQSREKYVEIVEVKIRWLEYLLESLDE